MRYGLAAVWRTLRHRMVICVPSASVPVKARRRQDGRWRRFRHRHWCWRSGIAPAIRFAMLAEKTARHAGKGICGGTADPAPQTQINLSQYGREEAGNLGAASYKLTAQTSGGRGVYSFCMCPGGFVVDASSEPGRLAINGMSNHDRAGANANSALL